MRIREGTEDDIEPCIQLGSAMHQESEYANLIFDNDICRDYGRRLIESNNACFFVAEEDGEIIGLVTGRVAQYMFGPEALSKEELLFVCPDKRKSSTGYRLMKTWLVWSREMGVSEAVFGSTAKHRDGFDAVTRRLGMLPVGRVYKKRFGFGV